MNFPAGQDVFLTVSVSTKDDDIVEPLENFTLQIEVQHDAFRHGVVQLENGTISLEDNDSECGSKHNSSPSTLQTLPISIDLSVNTWSACNTGVYCTYVVA